MYVWAELRTEVTAGVTPLWRPAPNFQNSGDGGNARQASTRSRPCVLVSSDPAPPWPHCSCALLMEDGASGSVSSRLSAFFSPAPAQDGAPPHPTRIVRRSFARGAHFGRS